MDSTSTSFIQNVMHDPILMISTIAAFITILGALYAIWRWMHLFLKNRFNAFWFKKRLGAELYTADDIISATQYYVRPKCRDVDPMHEEDMRAVHGVDADLFEHIDRMLDKPSRSVMSGCLEKNAIVSE